jgi:hypothetical protein
VSAYFGRRVDVLDRLRDLGSNAISLDERDRELALVVVLKSASLPVSKSQLHRIEQLALALSGPYIATLGSLEVGDLVLGLDSVRPR